MPGSGLPDADPDFRADRGACHPHGHDPGRRPLRLREVPLARRHLDLLVYRPIPVSAARPAARPPLRPTSRVTAGISADTAAHLAPGKFPGAFVCVESPPIPQPHMLPHAWRTRRQIQINNLHITVMNINTHTDF